MPRPPNPKAETSQYSMKIRSEWQIEFNAMKEICARNGINMNQEFYERTVRPFLREHKWPPGNSQTIFDSFGVIMLTPEEKWKVCKFAVNQYGSGTEFPCPCCSFTKRELFVGLKYARCVSCSNFQKK